MKNNYCLLPSLRAIWKRQFRHIFMLGVVGILLGLGSSGEVLGQTPVLTEDFGTSCGLPAGWSDTGADPFVYNAPNYSAGTDHTTGSGCFAAHDDSSDDGNGELVSPSMDLSGASSATLTFWLFNQLSAQSGDDHSSLYVDVSIDGGTNFTNNVGIYTTKYHAWTEITLDISSYTSATTVLRFRTVETNSFYSDVSIDDIEVTAVFCTPASPTFSTDNANCGSGNFDIVVNLASAADMGDADAIIITDDQGNTFDNGGAGYVFADFPVTIGSYAAGTDVIVTLDDNDVTCPFVSSSQTEACACSTLPLATVTSNAPDCGAGTFDIDVNITNLGGGTTANTGADIYVNGVLESSNVGLGITTINKPVGSYTVYVEGIGGTGFATCVSADESAAASCNNDECAEAFTVLTDGTPKTSLDVTTYTSSGNNLSCDGGSSNEDAYYKFVAPASGLVNITVDDTNLSGTNTIYIEGAVYASCVDAVSNTEVTCFSWSTPLNGGQTASGLTAGNTYYLEVEHYNNDWTGTYDVIITDLAPEIQANTQVCLDLSDATTLYDVGTAGEEFNCPMFTPEFTSSDEEEYLLYTPTANETVDVFATNAVYDDADGIYVGIFEWTPGVSATCLGGNSGLVIDGGATSGEINNVSLTGGTTYAIVVAEDYNDGVSVCIEIKAQCGVVYTNNLVNDCGAATFTRTLNFSSLGGATHVVIDDGEGTSFGTPTAGISTATDYLFSYTDLSTRTVTINGYDGASNLICSEELSLTAGCVSNICTEAINILGNNIPADMAVAVNDGSETDFGGEPNFQSCGNGVTIGNCSAGTYHSAYYETNYNDLWFVVDIPDGGNTFDVNLTNFTGAGHVYVLPYASSGDCSSLSLMDISNSGVAGGTCPTLSGNGTITFSGADIITASTNPIYLRVIPHENSVSSSAADACDTQITYPSFSIGASAPQANDICGDAINFDGVSSTGDLCQAAIETENSETGASCGETADANDLWYSVTMDAADNDQLLEVDLTFTNADDAVVIELYSNCFSSTFMECATVNSTGAGSTVTHAFSSIITAGGSGPTWYVRVTPVAGNSVCNFTIQGNRVAENNVCDIANQTFPTAFTITNPVLADFQFATPSNVDAQTASDLWYVFDPEANTDAYGHNVYSTEADVLVSGLAASEEITIMLYKRRSASSDLSCINYSDDYLNTLVISGNGTSTLSCLDEVYATSATSEGYIIRILQTAGSTDAAPTVTVTPSTDIPPFNNSCENIWDGDGPKILGSDLGGDPVYEAAHGYNAYYILNGETQTGNFSGATDCDSTIPSGMCNGVDYEAITESNDRDMWYVFTVPDNECATLGLTQSTVLYSMDITYNANNAFRDGIVYVYSDCDASSLIDCSGALDGAGTTWTVNGLTQGASYLLRVKPWDISSTPTDWTFDISVNESNPAPCNDDPENAEPLNVGCFNYSWLNEINSDDPNNLIAIPWSAQGATETAPVDGAPEKDVWFSFKAPSPANGGAYTTSKSWVTVFFESVTPHKLYVELYNTPSTETGSLVYETAASAGDQAWGVFGNLIPDSTYYIRMYHKEQPTVNVQYKIAVTDGPGDEVGWGCGNNGVSNVTGCASGCNDLRETWYKIDLPDGMFSYNVITSEPFYWTIEVTGMDQKLDFELRSKYLSGHTPYVTPCSNTEGALEGNCADFDHPCSSINLNEGTIEHESPSGGLAGCDGNDFIGDIDPNTPFDGDNAQGSGRRRVYSGLNGAAVVAGVPLKDYYYLRVYVDPTDPRYDDWAEVKICDISFVGPYTDLDDAIANNGNIETGFCSLYDFCDLSSGGNPSYPIVYAFYSDGRPYDSNNLPVSDGFPDDIVDNVTGDVITPAVWLGATIDAENESWENGGATADGSDEDGLIILDSGTPGGTATIRTIGNANGAGTTVYNGLWIDWNEDGVFETADFYTGSGITASPVNIDFSVNVPATYDAAEDTVYMRLKASPIPLSFADYATNVQNGEIEGHLFIAAPIIQFVSATSTTTEDGTVDVCVEIQNVDGTATTADVVFDAGDAGTATQTDDYTLSPAVPYTVSFPAGAANGDQICFTVTGVPDVVTDNNETINFDLENPTGTAVLGSIIEHTTTITEGAAGSIAGNVFLDLLANGLDDGTDTDIEGITVTLTNTGDASTMTMQTLADGSYSFTGLADGNYTVTFGMNDGTTTYDAFSLQNVGGDDTIDSDANATTGTTASISIAGNAVTDVDAGLYQNVTINGAFFNNNDGTVGTMPVADGTTENVVVTYCNDATCAATTDVTYPITTGNGNGTFSITDATPGIITAINGSPYTFEETTVVNTQTNFVSGSTISDQNFALYSISGNVFLDNYADGTTANLNGDGTGTDAAIQNITVTLTNTGDASTMTATTGVDGSYIFTGLADGDSYTVSFGTTDGTTTYDAFSPQNIGGDDSIDSEVNTSGVTNTITIASANVTDIDAGMYEYITISGSLFTDNNGTVGTTPVVNGTTETIIVTYCDDIACSSTTNVSYPITTTGNTFSITDAAPGIISAINSTNYTFEEASVVNANTPVASGGTVVEQDFAQQLNLPNAIDDTATTTPNTPINITNLVNDTFGNDGPSTGTITITVNPTNGTATVNDGGTPNDPTDDTVDYTPNTNYVGTDTVTYQICDSNGDCDTAIITITISSNCNANAGDF